MKKLYAIPVKLVAIVSLLLTNPSIQGQQPEISSKACDKIVFDVPALKCGAIKWDDSLVQTWLKNNCIEKCDDSDASGYAFSGKISGTDISNSLKVTITTNKDYAQPVRFNSADGTFKGTLYFDKTIQEKTIIKLMLRDSTRAVINTFTVTLTD